MVNKSKGTQNKAEPENDSLTQEYTESYGTGVHTESNSSSGGQSVQERLNGDNEDNLDASGEEAVGGTAPTPEQDIVDQLGAATGVEMDDKSALQVTETLEQRDSRRWELEPKSSEDYQERREE